VSSALQDQLQRTLGTEYSVDHELGGGGMSRVFLATEMALGRRVVIKALPPELAAAVSAERFRREIQLAAQLQHPHIVPLLTAGASEGLPYFTMPFVAGESLRARLAREKRLPVRDVQAILRDVAQALAYAHANGVVHRDIKPDNIMLSGGVALVTDFGVAKALSDAGKDSGVTSTGLALGTPAYMAPEQATADPHSDQRADLYALGAVAYEMLCGSMLFPGRSPQATMAAHAVERPTPVSACRPDAPPALAQLVMQMLEKDPAKRPESAAEVLRRLEESAAAPAPSRARQVIFTLAFAGALISAILVVVARGRAPSAAAPQSIAVLPFENSSGDQQDEYFSDGMAEELMTQLNKVPNLRVAARTSAFAFKGLNEDAREIGRKLDVGTVLEGSVRKSGNRMRVSARLVDARTGYQIWADEYQRDVADVFAVQDEVTAAIVGALRLRFAPPVEAAAPHETRDVAARDLYLQGRFFFEKRDEQNLDTAASFFARAIARDSLYAAAYAGLSETYAFLATFGYRSPAEMAPKARAAAAKAVLLDSTIAETHTAKGFTMLFYDWDYPGAEAEFKRAIELNPQYAPARLFLGWDYVAQGRIDEAVKALQDARDIDPLSLILNTRLASMYNLQRDYAREIAQARQTLAMDSTYALARFELARGYLASGRCKEAIAEAERGLAQVGDYERIVLWYAHARCGQRALAVQELERLLARSRTGYVSADVVSKLYVALGDRQKALDWLERAYDQNTWAMYLIKVEPMFDPLHGEPRFEALVQKMNLR